MEEDKRDQNLHTIEQIKASGHTIHTKKGESGLFTNWGNTYTVWVEAEPGYYTPVNAFVRDRIWV